MAKKKDFSNIVAESFNDGYVSEPEVEVVAKEGKKAEATAVVDEAPATVEEPATEVVEETVTPPAEEAEQAVSEEVVEETSVEETTVDATPAEEVVTENVDETVTEVVDEPVTEAAEEPVEELTESEILLKRLTDGDEEILNKLLYTPERKTYYYTGIQRACVEIMAREEALTLNGVIDKMFNEYFSDAIKEVAKEEVVRKEIKILKRKIEEEKKNK